MRAVVFREPGRVEVADVPAPEIRGSGDALVRVQVTGICGSDLHFVHGKAPLQPGETIGHEVLGTVERVGEGVTRFAPGDRVVGAFAIACGACWFCRHGQTQLCDRGRILGTGVVGGSLGGAQAELVRVPDADVNLLAVPDAVTDDRALFVGDGLSTAYHAAEIASIDPGETVAVVGAGPIGYLSAAAARLHDPAEVIAIDLEPERLALVEGVGAVSVDAGRQNPQTAVYERTDGRGADVVVEAVGTAPAFERALDVVRRGGRVVVAGVYASEVVEAQLGVWWSRALDVRFTGLCPVHAVWERAMAEVVRGRLDPEPLVSHRLPLEEAASGYELFHARRATKVLLYP
ncbi:MAG TPA: alcohol dehydrogenase catalytic domain-containing protein [Actinomycetota bacterium]